MDQLRARHLLFLATLIGTVTFLASEIGAAEAIFTLVDERIDDTPIKTQIEQHVVVSGVPSRMDLEAEISSRYRAASQRRGFRYHNPATNIYVYVYASEEQARAGQGLWVGMLAKGPSDPDRPQVQVNEERFAALAAEPEPEQRFGLSEGERRNVYREIAAAEDRATREAMSRVPDTQIIRQIELEGELSERYKSEVAQKYELTDDQLVELVVEGVRMGWPAP